MKALSRITKKDIKAAIKHVISGGLTKQVILGASGRDVLLHGTKHDGRCEVVSIRLHSSGVELLITNQNGAFLCYNKYDERLGLIFITNRHWETFNKLKPAIKSNTVKLLFP